MLCSCSKALASWKWIVKIPNDCYSRSGANYLSNRGRGLLDSPTHDDNVGIFVELLAVDEGC